jgi:hypothetical protein
LIIWCAGQLGDIQALDQIMSWIRDPPQEGFAGPDATTCGAV